MPFSPVESEEQRLKRQKKALRAHYRMLRKQISPESRNLLEKLYGGSIKTFANALCDSGLSREDLEELRSLLERDAL